MADPETPGPSPPDQGLFLAHFNRGRAAFDARRYADAQRDLEEACLLRPRDQRVLSLLGLAYFKQERFDKAVEIYRKLLAESPEVPTLHYNLALICFKLARFDEAEAAFLKALELSGENAKIRFYLGLICERQHRFQDAIYHYRQAGAPVQVRRVADRLGGDPDTRPGPATPPPTPPPTPSGAFSLPGRDDTARIQPADVLAALQQGDPDGAALAGSVRVEPVGRPLLSDDAPPRGATNGIGSTPPDSTDAARVRSDTARFRLDGSTEPPEPFRVLANALVEVNVKERVFIRPGTLYSYSGAFTFWVKERRPGGHPALAIAAGKGRLMLRDRERDVTFLRVDNEILTVEPEHLLACEASLQPRFVSVGEGPSAEFLVLEGRGLVALSVGGRPLALSVEPDLPVSVPAACVITWSGALSADLLDDPELLDTAAPVPPTNRAWLRFAGQGRVLVEQIRS